MDGYEQSQVSRKNGEFISARKTLEACSADACPEFIRDECSGWLKEVNGSIASFVIVANTPDGQALDDVEVELDGKLLARVVGARAMEADPGEHALVMTHLGEKVSRRLVLREGERNHQVVVEFGARSSDTASGGAASTLDAGTQSNSDIYGLGGVGLLGLAAFTYFGLDGLSQKHEMEDTCKPACTQDQVDDAERAFLFADIGLLVGVASLTGAVYLFLTREPPKSAERYRSRFAVAPVNGGGLGMWRGSF